MKINDKKLNGVVYTPQWIVKLILDHLNYKDGIYNNSIIDPACGEGAFLSQIVERVIKDAKKNCVNNSDIKKYLEKNIFGFDIDEKAIKNCISILDNISRNYNLSDIKWKIFKIDSLD